MHGHQTPLFLGLGRVERETNTHRMTTVPLAHAPRINKKQGIIIFHDYYKYMASMLVCMDTSFLAHKLWYWNLFAVLLHSVGLTFSAHFSSKPIN